MDMVGVYEEMLLKDVCYQERRKDRLNNCSLSTDDYKTAKRLVPYPVWGSLRPSWGNSNAVFCGCSVFKRLNPLTLLPPDLAIPTVHFFAF